MAPPLQPEFFLLVGVDLFLAISLLVCLLDRHFPWHLPYLYQAAALMGFAQLLVSREFMTIFDEYMRFWYSLIYLVVALANTVAINAYLGFMKKLLNYAKVFLFTVTFPALSLAAFFLSSYSQVAVHPLVILPQMSWEATFVAIVALDTAVVGLGTYIFFKPRWWYIAAGAGTAITGASIYAAFRPTVAQGTFVGSAIALTIACVLVLGISVYVLTKMWAENWKETRRRKKEVKKQNEHKLQEKPKTDNTANLIDSDRIG